MRRITDAFRRWRQRRRDKIVKKAVETHGLGEPPQYHKDVHL